MDIGVSKTTLKTVAIVFAALAIFKIVGSKVSAVESVRNMIVG